MNSTRVGRDWIVRELNGLRRGVATLKSELTGDADQPEYEECHLLECFAAKSYREILDTKELPEGLGARLKTQLERTEAAMAALRILNRDKDHGASSDEGAAKEEETP